jgi:hypothetical protein
MVLSSLSSLRSRYRRAGLSRIYDVRGLVLTLRFQIFSSGSIWRHVFAMFKTCVIFWAHGAPCAARQTRGWRFSILGVLPRVLLPRVWLRNLAPPNLLNSPRSAFPNCTRVKRDKDSAVPKLKRKSACSGLRAGMRSTWSPSSSCSIAYDDDDDDDSVLIPARVMRRFLFVHANGYTMRIVNMQAV